MRSGIAIPKNDEVHVGPCAVAKFVLQFDDRSARSFNKFGSVARISMLKAIVRLESPSSRGIEFRRFSTANWLVG